jgi:hypothetical protein
MGNDVPAMAAKVKFHNDFFLNFFIKQIYKKSVRRDNSFSSENEVSILFLFKKNIYF